MTEKSTAWLTLFSQNPASAIQVSAVVGFFYNSMNHWFFGKGKKCVGAKLSSLRTASV